MRNKIKILLAMVIIIILIASSFLALGNKKSEKDLIKPLPCLYLNETQGKTLSVMSNLDSMIPTIKSKDIVVSELVTDLSSLKIGDIIIFNIDNESIAHRIIEVSKLGFYTKGDNNTKEEFTPNFIIREKVLGIIC